MLSVSMSFLLLLRQNKEINFKILAEHVALHDKEVFSNIKPYNYGLLGYDVM